MNYSAYIFGSSDGVYSQYPSDHNHSKFKELGSKSGAPAQVIIHRDDNLMYYGYIRKTGPRESDYFGLCILLNDLAINNTDSLFAFFEKMIETLAVNGGVLELDENAEIISHYLSTDNNQIELEKIKMLFDVQMSGLEGCWIKLPPTKYSIANNEIKTFVATDDAKEIIESSTIYPYTIICKTEEYDTIALTTYRGKLLSAIKEKESAIEKYNNLSADYRHLQHKQKQYRLVLFLAIGVLVCMLGLFFVLKENEQLKGDYADKQEELDAANLTKSELEETVKSLKDKLKKTESDLKNKKAELQLRVSDIEELERKYELATETISQLESEKENLKSEIATTKKKLTTANNQAAASSRQPQTTQSKPFIINKIEVATVDRNGALHLNFGDMVFGFQTKDDVKFRIRIEYTGKAPVEKKLLVKWKFPTSKKFNEQKKSFNVLQGNQYFSLDDCKPPKSEGMFERGKYEIEIWCDGEKYGAYSFDVF